MNAFLLEVKKVYETILINPTYYDCLSVVLGNESCDLDSAICSLVYAFVLHHEGIEEHLSKRAVLPLFNIDHDDFSLKTEVCYFLKENNISLDFIPTRGSRHLLDLSKINKENKLKLFLVDHHTLPPSDENLRSAVVEIIDHRSQDPNWPWDGINVTNEPVGSCASLIAHKILQRSPYLMTSEIAKLLLGAIVLDTVNLSPDAGRATSKDHEVVDILEKTIAIETLDRKQLFDDLVRAKADISSLSVAQILYKDLKVIAGIPVAGAPILLEGLSRRDNLASAAHKFMTNRKASAMVLMGVQIEGETVFRDLAVAWLNEEVGEQILDALLSCQAPNLELNEIKRQLDSENMRLFRQGNIKATRKHIGPIIAEVASKCI